MTRLLDRGAFTGENRVRFLRFTIEAWSRTRQYCKIHLTSVKQALCTVIMREFASIPVTTLLSYYIAYSPQPVGREHYNN